jgi:hypothetical protein
MAKQTVSFVKREDKKNSVRFDEKPVNNEPQLIGSLYVQKWFARDATRLSVTVENPDAV